MIFDAQTIQAFVVLGLKLVAVFVAVKVLPHCFKFIKSVFWS